MTGFTGWKQALPDGRKFSAVEKNELFGTDFETFEKHSLSPD